MMVHNIRTKLNCSQNAQLNISFLVSPAIYRITTTTTMSISLSNVHLIGERNFSILMFLAKFLTVLNAFFTIIAISNCFLTFLTVIQLFSITDSDFEGPNMLEQLLYSEHKF